MYYDFKTIIPLLIQRNANVNLQNTHGHSALVRSFKTCNRDFIKQIIAAKAILELIDSQELAPLEHTVVYGEDIAQLLLENGANTFINMDPDTINFMKKYLTEFSDNRLGHDSISIIIGYL